MRRITAVHWLLSGYCIGLCLAVAVHPAAWVLVAVAASAALLALAIAGTEQCARSPVRSNVRRTATLVALALAFAPAGLAVGGWRLQTMGQSSLAGHVGSRGTLAAVVTGLPTLAGDRLNVPVRVTAFAGRRVNEPAHLALRVSKGSVPVLDTRSGLVEGVRISLASVAVAALKAPLRGEFDYRRYLQRHGEHVALAGRLGDVRLTGRRGGWLGLVDRLRLASRGHLRLGLHSPVRDVVQGMVLGDDQYVPQAVIDGFRRSGLLHILAVSGENVVLLCAMWGFLLTCAGVGRTARSLILMPMVVAYTVLCGASPSIVRAGVAGVLGLLAALVSRPSDGWLLWLAPAAWLLSMNPFTLCDASFQLTFAAVAGLLVLARPFAELLRFLPRSLAEAMAVTGAASVATAPVSLLTFGSASIVAVPANIAGGFVLGPIMFLGMLSVLLGFVVTPVCLPLNLVAGLFTGFLVSVSSWFGGPSWAVYEWHGLTLGLSLIVCAAIEAYVLWRLARRQGTGLRAYVGDRRRQVHVVLVTALVAGAALMLTPAAPAAPRLPTLTILDVGEGAAALLQAPGGPTILIDAGPAPLANVLRDHGVRRIDLLVLSHGHADHTAGLSDVLGAILITRALVPRPPTPNPPLTRVTDELRTARVPLQQCVTPLRFAGGAFSLAVLPTAPVPGESGNQSENDGALVVVVTLAGQGVLLPGDAEGQALARLPLDSTTVVELPHHGSRDGLDEQLLATLRPRLSVVSVGPNTFGHPTRQMLVLMASHHVPCLRTDQSGDVTFTAQPHGLLVSVQRR